ncbi:Cornichon protein [Giardia duodenalis]|uniref:Cornichon protein n=1 Tax=Giardia intestinalis (strain ATCC 50803 / WB clone C6) TaxID=184922 RepID=A8BBA9_GIAIC|nr:Cornichon protein [Giardia intestinalis]KAE8302045.1 Cornichon protein [Giardia intestinalis]|eukprot:XP_001708249.1 Hypothetical protein GL50803_28549 [Giardia lamblia ATCC 50803]
MSCWSRFVFYVIMILLTTGMIIVTTIINSLHYDMKYKSRDIFQHNRRVNLLVKFDIAAPVVFFVVSIFYRQVILPILCLPFIGTTIVLYKENRLFFTPNNLQNRLKFDEKYSLVKMLMYSGLFVYLVIRGAVQLGICLSS